MYVARKENALQLEGKVIVVTGGGHGIGRALCQRFAREGPKGIVVADIDDDAGQQVSREISGHYVSCDVSREEDVQRVVEEAETKYGPVDLFCSNAGITMPGGLDLSVDQWRRLLDVNFMSHLYAARAVVPGMVERGGGYLLHTASAAGLLTEVVSAPYAVSKHAVVSLAEWLSITYAERGIRVSCICPQGVRTRMLAGDHPLVRLLEQSAVDPGLVADCTVEGLRDERFLILPHPEVAEYFERKGSDYDRWLRGMRRLWSRISDEID